MKNVYLIMFSILILVFNSSCKKEKGMAEDEKTYGYLTYHGLTVASNPSNYTKSNELTTIDDFWAELKEVNGVQQLKIYWGDQYNNTTITVDYTGIDNYSSDHTNLQCAVRSYNGLSNPTYTIIKGRKGTGGYMEILSDENGVITGNIRFILGYRDIISNSYKYTGIDDGKFEIKLR